ncbi:cytochrome c-type biogenesis protein CcmE [Salinisphaera hydrothermalis EPR70]
MLLVGMLMVGLGAAATLGLSAFRQNLLYFHQPSQIVAGQVPVNTRFRIGGLVKYGSVQRHGRSLQVRFAVADCQAAVPVVFKGTLPDLFREGQGVIAYGTLDKQGVFEADQVLAKHDASYMSSDVAKALKNGRKTSCMPARIQASR